MSIRKILVPLFAGFVLSLFLPPIYALEEKREEKPVLDKTAANLVGVWEIFQTKEPGKPYRSGYSGHPFVSKGPNAFTLIMVYRKDGTFRRVNRIGLNETVQEGTWQLTGHELRHKVLRKRKGSRDEEVMYLRFDDPDRYTSLEVYEATPDPGLFAQFRRVKGVP